MKYRLITTIIFIIILLIPNSLTLAETINITATVSTCQDGQKTSPEQCDGLDFGGETCQTQGFYGGFISCNLDCTVNTSQCFSKPASNPSGYIIVPKDQAPIPSPPVSPTIPYEPLPPINSDINPNYPKPPITNIQNPELIPEINFNNNFNSEPKNQNLKFTEFYYFKYFSLLILLLLVLRYLISRKQ